MLQEFTDRELAIATVLMDGMMYTPRFSLVQQFIEELEGNPIFTHELADTKRWASLKCLLLETMLAYAKQSAELAEKSAAG